MAVLFQASPRLIIIGYGLQYYIYIYTLDSIKKATAIINGLDQDRYSKVLSRVIQRFHIKVHHAYAWAKLSI